MKFVRYNDQVAIIVRSGRELCSEFPDSDLEDHVGLWFGEVNSNGQPVVYSIPAEYVNQSEKLKPEYQH